MTTSLPPSHYTATAAHGSLTVVHVAAEHGDLARTGGLGEVLSGLTRAQARAGARVSVLLPGYRQALERLRADERGTEERGVIVVPMPWGPAEFRLEAAIHEDVELILFDEPAFFDRSGLFGPDGQAYSDNPVRFAAFCRAAARYVQQGERPDAVHLHDYHAGLVAPLLAADPAHAKLLQTVHNLAFQGVFPVGALDITGLSAETLGLDGVLHRGGISLLKAGLQYADLVTTVSPTYARELQTDEGGWDLAGLFRWRAERLVGIVNGIDTHAIARSDPAERPARRRALLDLHGLRCEGPLFGLVGRLTSQKGIDLFIEAAPRFLSRGAAAIVLGSGEADLARQLHALAAAFSDRVAFVEAFAPHVAERIFDSVDVICVPSRFEPCGMVQLHAMYQGAIPLVRRTGGLADTVRDVAEGGWGFVFDDATPEAMAEAMERAWTLHEDGEAWRRTVAQAMAQPVGWENPAKRYLELYAG